MNRQEAARKAGVNPAEVRAHYDFGDGRVCVVVADPGDVISPGEKIWIGTDKAQRGGTSTATADDPGAPTDGGDGSGIPHVPFSAALVQELVAQEMERQRAAEKAAQAEAAKAAPATPTGPTGDATGVSHVTQIEDDGRPENKGGAGNGDPANPTGPAAPAGPTGATGTTGPRSNARNR